MSDTPAEAVDTSDTTPVETSDTTPVTAETSKRARSSSNAATEAGESSGPSKRSRQDLIPEDAVFDEVHNDPTATIILITNSSAKKTYFRVHRHALIKSCGMFHDLLSLFALYPEPIDFPARRFILSAFLTLVYQYPNTIPPTHLNSHDLLQLLDLAEKYDSPHMITAILKAFDSGKMTRPWRLFVLASQRDDVELARRALKGLRVEDKGRISECGVENWELVKDVEKPYLYELLRLLRQQTIPPKPQIERIKPKGLPTKPPPQDDPNNHVRNKIKRGRNRNKVMYTKPREAPGQGRQHWHGKTDLEPGVEFGIAWRKVAEEFVPNTEAGKAFVAGQKAMAGP